MSDKSLYDVHNEFVKELLERGEFILMPKNGKPMEGTPLGYVKNLDNPPAGYIYRNKMGIFELHYDHFQAFYTGINWKDIGLCDARCLYEWRENNAKEIQEYYKDVSGDYKMPENFRWKIECQECENGADSEGHDSMSSIDAWLSGHIISFGHIHYELIIYGSEIDEIKKMVKDNRNNVDLEKIQNIKIEKCLEKNEWNILDNKNGRKIATLFNGDLAILLVEKYLGMELDKYGIWKKKIDKSDDGI